MLKICTRGHITGYRHCPQCPRGTRNNTIPMVVVGPPRRSVDVLLKRWVTKMIRASGGVPVADLRQRFQ